jgi:hypothetical protein
MTIYELRKTFKTGAKESVLAHFWALLVQNQSRFLRLAYINHGHDLAGEPEAEDFRLKKLIRGCAIMNETLEDASL